MAFPAIPVLNEIVVEGGHRFQWNGTAWNRLIVQEADSLVYDPAQWALASPPDDADEAIDALSSLIGDIDSTAYKGTFDPTDLPGIPAAPEAGDWYEVIVTASTVAAWPTGIEDIPISTAMTEGDRVRYDGTNWYHLAIGGGGASTTLTALTDTTIAGAAVGDFLRIASTSPTDWQNVVPNATMLSDIDTSGVVNEDLLQYVAANGQWEPVNLSVLIAGGFSITNLTDVAITVDDNAGTFFVFDGTNFVPSKASAGVAGEIPYYAGGTAFAHLAPPGDSNDYALTWDGSAYAWSLLSSVLPAGGTSHVLYHNGSAWVSLPPGSSGQYLQYNGSTIVWATGAGGGGATQIDELSDAEFTSWSQTIPQEGDMMAFQTDGVVGTKFGLVKRPIAGFVNGEEYWLAKVSGGMQFVKVTDYQVPWDDRNPPGGPGAMWGKIGSYNETTDKIKWSEQPADGSLLWYDNATKNYKVVTPTTTDDTMKWNGTAWVRTPFKFVDLADINIVSFGPTDDGKAVVWDNASSKFVGDVRGDLTGPGSSTANTFPVFSTTDGVTIAEFAELTKDSTDLSLSTSMKCDTFSEYTLAAGITLDGVQLKDGLVDTIDVANPAKSIVVAAGKYELDGDSAAPGNNYFYGTNGSGTKGWYSSVTYLLAGDIDTLAEINAIITDATLIDTADSRLSDARTPTAHTASHTDGTDDIQNATAAQKGLATAAQITKLDAIEALADVTDATNVAAAGAHMSGGTDVPVTDGGTGASTAGAARTNLGLAIGTDVQAHSAVLDATTASFLTADETKLDGIEALADVTDQVNVRLALAALLAPADFNGQAITNVGTIDGVDVGSLDAANGLVAFTGVGFTNRTIVSSGNGIGINSGDGAAGNPTISYESTISALTAMTAQAEHNTSTAWHTALDGSIPAGALGTDRGIRVRIVGRCRNDNAGSTSTRFDLRVTYGSTVMFEDTGGRTIPDSGATIRAFEVVLELYARDSTAAQIVMGRTYVSGWGSATTGIGYHHLDYIDGTWHGTAAEDSTGALNLKVEIAQSVSDVNTYHQVEAVHVSYI